MSQQARVKELRDLIDRVGDLHRAVAVATGDERRFLEDFREIEQCRLNLMWSQVRVQPGGGQ